MSKHSHKLLFLDGLRGIAALYVVIGHARGFLWEGYSDGYKKHAELYGFFDRLSMYFFTLFKFGHEVVLFFFVLSGFVIHLKYAKQYQANSSTLFAWKDYVWRRIKRIYPPFVMSIGLTFLLDTIGKYNGYALYTGAVKLNMFDIELHHNLKTLVGNVLFLFREYVPLFGSNGPSWSLKYEWWFYMIYPLCLLISKKSIWPATIIMVVLFTISFYPSIWPEQLLRDVLSLMLSWWLGVLLAEVYVKRVALSFGYLALLMLIFPFCPAIGKINDVLYFTAVAAGMAGILSLCFWLQQKNISLFWIEKLQWLGNFSYTLYIIHFPIFMLLSGYWMQQNNNTLPKSSWLILAGSLLVTAIAYAVHFITERPFTKSANAVKLKLTPP